MDASAIELIRNAARRPRVENIVCTALVKKQLPPSLQTLATRGQFSPNVFPAAVSRFDEPNCATVSFDTGKTVVLGTRNPNDALFQLYSMLMHIYIVTGHASLPHEFRVENVVGSAWLGQHVDLPRLARDLCMQTVYEDSVFPGVHMNLKSKKREEKTIVFKKGRMVITGAKHPRQIGEAFEVACQMLAPYTIAPPSEPAQQAENKHEDGDAKLAADADEYETEEDDADEDDVAAIARRLKLSNSKRAAKKSRKRKRDEQPDKHTSKKCKKT